MLIGRRAEMTGKLFKVVEEFRKMGAVSPEGAMSFEELGLPPRFIESLKERLGRLGVFVEIDGKYYLSEKRLEEVMEQRSRRRFNGCEDIMFDGKPRPLSGWHRHTASVPKGFLRYFVIRLLKDKPMSGSEMMEEIEKLTGGRWKPSPGSVYPLLVQLKENGYTKELSAGEGGIKRHMLTEKGEKFSEEQARFGERLRKKLEFMAPLLFGGFWFSPHFEKLREIREPVRRFAVALVDLRTALEENLTEQAIREVGEILKENAEKIEEVSKKIRGEN